MNRLAIDCYEPKIDDTYDFVTFEIFAADDGGDCMAGMDGITGMVGILVDDGMSTSFGLFNGCPTPEALLFRHDDLKSSRLNPGKAAVAASVVSLKHNQKFSERIQLNDI